jgi:DNA-directed RNA polymerase subunit H (RpoH/RPB5)
LNTKLTFEEKEVKIINEEEEKTDYKKEKITQEQLFQILWNYE